MTELAVSVSVTLHPPVGDKSLLDWLFPRFFIGPTYPVSCPQALLNLRQSESPPMVRPITCDCCCQAAPRGLLTLAVDLLLSLHRTQWRGLVSPAPTLAVIFFTVTPVAFSPALQTIPSCAVGIIHAAAFLPTYAPVSRAQSPQSGGPLFHWHPTAKLAPTNDLTVVVSWPTSLPDSLVAHPAKCHVHSQIPSVNLTT